MVDGDLMKIAGNMYYVYIHKKPDGDIFYVGKGKNKRAFDKANRNSHWQSVVNKYGYHVDIVIHNLTEPEALGAERALIQYLKTRYKLCNMNEGGAGLFGRRQSKQAVEKIRAASKGRRHSPEAREKMSAAKRGIAFWPKGRRRSPEFCQRLMERMTGRIVSDQTREKLRAVKTGVKHKESTIQKMKQARQEGTHNSMPLVVCGRSFQSMTSFAKFVGVSPLAVKKWKDKNNIPRMELAYIEATSHVS